MLLKGSTGNRLGEFFNIELVSSTRRTVVVKLVSFSYAFRLTVADFFREFYKCGLFIPGINHINDIQRYFLRIYIEETC